MYAYELPCMAQLKTPGVYVSEHNTFPNTVSSVNTSIPAFIGFTEKSVQQGRSLLNQAVRITSLDDFVDKFGDAPPAIFNLSVSPITRFQNGFHGETATGMKAGVSIGKRIKKPSLKEAVPEVLTTLSGREHSLSQALPHYRLYDSMRLFFANGGQTCYVVSVGEYGDVISQDALIGLRDKRSGIYALLQEIEPTMLVIPEVMSLEAEEVPAVHQAMLSHCNEAGSRIAILDVHQGYQSRTQSEGDIISSFRSGLGESHLKFGCAYYPWIETDIVQPGEVGLHNLTDRSKEILRDMLKMELLSEKGREALEFGGKRESLPSPDQDAFDLIEKVSKSHLAKEETAQMESSLLSLSDSYQTLHEDIRSMLNLMPPAAAMAGVFSTVDEQRGVWKAPANVSMKRADKPSVEVNQAEQEDLNAPSNGKSVNAIRYFPGQGTMVWGSRTLAGNHPEDRYINVRRTLIMAEQSIKKSLQTYVFEPNDATTRVEVRALISNYLQSLWMQGAFAGSKSSDAFHVSLAEEDVISNRVNDGKAIRITVGLALLRPAEFMQFTFLQPMLSA